MIYHLLLITNFMVVKTQCNLSIASYVFIFFLLFICIQSGGCHKVNLWLSPLQRGIFSWVSASGYSSPSEPQEVHGSKIVFELVSRKLQKFFHRQSELFGSLINKGCFSQNALSNDVSLAKSPSLSFLNSFSSSLPLRLNALLFSILCSCYTSSLHTQPRHS